MANISDYLKTKLNDLVLGAAALSAPGTVYFALFTAAPNSAGGGTEVSGGSYARVAVTNNSTNFPAANSSTGVKANGSVITFPTASGSWGSVTHWGIFDANSGGNLLYFGALTQARSVASGDTPRFAIGDLTVTIA